MSDLREQLGRLEESISDVKDDVKYIRRVIDGDGDPDKGLTVRVALLEQRHRPRRVAGIATILAAAAGIASKLFKGHG